MAICRTAGPVTGIRIRGSTRGTAEGPLIVVLAIAASATFILIQMGHCRITIIASGIAVSDVAFVKIECTECARALRVEVD